jgi:hypothetical protein
MSSSNTIAESVVVAAPVVIAAPVVAKVVQRKKKTVPVIAKHEESTDAVAIHPQNPFVVPAFACPEIAQTLTSTSPVLFTLPEQGGTTCVDDRGITGKDLSSKVNAETLIGIMQTKPIIQTPKHKKKNATVADIVAPKIPKQNKKKNIKSPETQTQVDEPIAENTLEVVVDVPIEVVAPAPKVPKKRAPKKKVEVPVTTSVEPNMDNIESLFGNMTIQVDETIIENTLEVVAPAPKVPKKRAPKKKVEVPVTIIVEPNMDNIESLFENMTIAEESVPQNTLAQPIVVVTEAR